MAKTVMIVDDSTTMLMSLEGILLNGGYKVEKADDGDVALSMVQKGSKPDLIITDYHMPRMNGLDFIKAARIERAGRFVPILVLTTEAQDDLRQQAKAAGATGWLIKPVMPDQLLKVIQQVVPGA